MDEERIAFLNKLKDATETILKEAQGLKNAELAGQAVNWADLHCLSAEYRLDEDGNEYYAVVICEASPDASRLASYVYVKLQEVGFDGISVEPEW